MPIHKNYIDTKENLLKMKEVIPTLIEDLKSGKLDPGVDQLFMEKDEDESGDLTPRLDREAPCCTMGHLFYRAGLASDISTDENCNVPSTLFGDTDVAFAVSEVSVTNDFDYSHRLGHKPEHRKDDLVHDLETLESVINEALERL